MPARFVKSRTFAIPYAQIAHAQIHLTAGNHDEALDTVRQALAAAAQRSYRLEEVASLIEFSGKSTKRWGSGRGRSGLPP